MHVLCADADGLHVRRVRLIDRIAASVGSDGLDEQLAGGTTPESRRLLAVRATQLGRRRHRQQTGVALRRVLRQVGAGRRGGLRTRMPIAPQAVQVAGPTLEGLAERILSDGPVDIRDLAWAHRLVTDGTGPLYRRGQWLAEE